MTLQDMLTRAKSSIRIVGTNPLIPHLEQSTRFLADLLILNESLRIFILCESDTENFNQSLCTDDPSSSHPLSFASMSVHRDRILGTGRKGGLIAEIRDLLETDCDAGLVESILRRIHIRQVHLRLPLNMIDVDGNLWCCVTTNTSGTIDSYFPVVDERLKSQLLKFIDFYVSPETGGTYLSRPGEELIQLYDGTGIPRGIFPRSCFYTTKFSRYSIWGFVFNRNGFLLLHKRSPAAKDGRNLWDKSIGGHVDLLDSSTDITAKRELVEELFLPEAEYTKYIRADLGEIMDFGEWNPRKRPEGTFRQAFAGLGASDWVMFRATDANGAPLTITRVSDRLIHDRDCAGLRTSVFRSDIFLFISPPNYLDTDEQMAGLLGHTEISGAAGGHRLVSVVELRRWISTEVAKGTARDVFTDDMLFINIEYRDMLERFAEFASFISGR